MREIETDYLVVGAGASGMAFVDALLAGSDADVVIADRRHGPGGHWLDAYPFVRLHQPSAYYGVNSRVLGNDHVDETGPNAGFYERASAAEILAICIRESVPSCMRAPPDAEKITRAPCSCIARSISRVTFSPTADPIEPPMNDMSIAPVKTR